MGIKMKASNNVDICIISPGLLETGTIRGGGCEVTDYNVALQLSKYFDVSIVSTYKDNYKCIIPVNEHFTIEQIFFPALKNYPFKSKFEIAMNHFSTFLYSFTLTKNTSRPTVISTDANSDDESCHSLQSPA